MPIRRATPLLLLLPVLAQADEEQIFAWTRSQGECDQALDQARYPDAEAACQQAMRLGEKLEPGLFFDTSLNGLTLAYLRQQRYAEAETAIKRLLETRTAMFGAEHPLTASAMNLLAAVYRKTGKEAEAKQLDAQFRRVEDACGGALDETARERIAQGASLNPCDPWPVPDFLR